MVPAWVIIVGVVVVAFVACMIAVKAGSKKGA